MSDFRPPEYVEYPRDSFQPSGEFSRPPGVYFDALGDAWKLVTRDLGTWAGLAIVGLIVIMLLQMPFQVAGYFIQQGGSWDPYAQPDFNIGLFLLSTLLNVLGGAVAYPVQAGLLYVALKQIRGEEIAITDVFAGFSSFLPLAIFGAVYSILLPLSALACLFPAIYVLGGLSMGPLLIMDRNASVGEALREGFRVLKSQAWLFGLFVIVAGIVSSLGVLACCVGFLVTFPIYIVSIALHYNYFFPKTAMAYTPPPATGL